MNNMFILVFAAALLGGCATLLPSEPLPIPAAPAVLKAPPDTYLEECRKTLQVLPENRPVGQAEAWQTAISWARDYHICAKRHAYLSGWIAGSLVPPAPPEPKPKKKKRFGIF